LWRGAAGERQSVRPARTRMKVGLFVRPRIRASGSSPREVVAALKAKPGRDIWLYGGGDFFRSLLNARLVDTVEVAVVPVLLGAGVLLLPPGTATKLTLADHKTLPASGIMALSYSIPGGVGPAPALGTSRPRRLAPRVRRSIDQPINDNSEP